MKRKLDIAKERKVQEGNIVTKIELDQTEQVKKLEEVNESIKGLWQLLNDKEEYDFNLLVDQIKTLHTRLDFTPIISGLEKLTTSQTNSLNKQLDIKDFSKLLKAVEDNKPVPVDLGKLEKAIIQVEQRIQEGLVKDQAPDDFQPVRRVIKVGNRLVYDDQPTPSRGGGGGSSGGGSSTGGLTDAELRASPIDVNATVSTAGLATDTKQDEQTAILTTMDTSLNDIETAVEIIDNAIAGSEMQVDVVTMPIVAVTQSGTWDEVGINDSGNSITVDNAQLSVVGGGTEAAAMRITIANDSTGVLSVDDNGGSLTVDNAGLTELAAAIDTEVQVDVVGALPAGNNNIGDVDIASSALPTGAATSAKQDTAQTSLDTIAGDTTAIQAAVEILDNAISGSEMQVDVLSSALPTGASTLAEQQTQTASLSVLDDWDDGADSAKVVGNVASGVADAGSPVKVGGKNNTTKPTLTDGQRGNVELDTRGNLEVALFIPNSATPYGNSADNVDGVAVSTTTNKLQVINRNTVFNGTTWDRMSGDTTGINVKAIVGALPAGTNAIGKLAANSGVDIGDVTLTAGTAAVGTLLPPDIDITTHANYAKKYYTNAGAVTDGIVWSSAAGKRWHIVSLFVNVSAAATVTFEDDLAAGDSVVLKMELAANSGTVIPFPEKYPLASGEDAADLLVTTSAGNCYITVVGYEI